MKRLKSSVRTYVEVTSGISKKNDTANIVSVFFSVAGWRIINRSCRRERVISVFGTKPSIIPYGSGDSFEQREPLPPATTGRRMFREK